MRTIYVAHPFSNDKAGNMKKIDRLMKKLVKKYPDICFVSPLHNFSYDKNAKEEEILQKCFEILSRCGELWAFGNYENSYGCRAEIAYAKYLSIPVSLRNESEIFY